MHGLLGRGTASGRQSVWPRGTVPLHQHAHRDTVPLCLRGGTSPDRGPPAFPRGSAAARRGAGTGQPGRLSGRSCGLRPARGRGEPEHPQGAGLRRCLALLRGQALPSPQLPRLGSSPKELLRKLSFKDAAALTASRTSRPAASFPSGSSTSERPHSAGLPTAARRAELLSTPRRHLPALARSSPRPGRPSCRPRLRGEGGRRLPSVTAGPVPERAHPPGASRIPPSSAGAARAVSPCPAPEPGWSGGGATGAAASKRAGKGWRRCRGFLAAPKSRGQGRPQTPRLLPGDRDWGMPSGYGKAGTETPSPWAPATASAVPAPLPAGASSTPRRDPGAPAPATAGPRPVRAKGRGGEGRRRAFCTFD